MDSNDSPDSRSPSRDFYAEGVDAFLAGHPDIPPSDVSEHGLDAEAAWIDGFMSGEDDEDRHRAVIGMDDDLLINSL